MLLTLVDSETNKRVQLDVSESDYDRAQIDSEFAASLLHGAQEDETMFEVRNNDEWVKMIEEDEDVGFSQSAGEGIYRWSRPEIFLLLETYKTLKEKLPGGKGSGKTFNTHLANILRDKGYPVTEGQCKSKIMGLKRQYKLVMDPNHTSEKKRRHWPYANLMEEIFGGDLWEESMTVSTKQHTESSASTARGHSKSSLDKKDKVVDFLAQLREDRERQHREKMRQKERVLTTEGKDDNIIDILKDIRMDRERHHQERMKQKEKALDLLRGIFNSMNSKKGT